MKNILLFCVTAIVLFSCSSAYKAASTPDDVYYSPSRTIENNARDKYDAYTSGSEDSYLRMKVRNRYQWNAIDDYSYWNDSRYDFGYSCFPSREVLLRPYSPYLGFGFGYSYYYSPWYNWYSPYNTIVYYKNPKTYYGNTSKTNLTSYRNGNYNNRNNNSTFGSLLGKAFNNNNNSSFNVNNNNSTRTFNTGTTPSSSAGGRSGGFNSTRSSGTAPRSPR